MRTSATLPGVLPAAQLAPLFAAEPADGYVTAYLDTTVDEEKGRFHLEQRWAALRHDLAAAGAPPAALEAVGEALPDAVADGPGLAVVAGARGLVLREGLVRAPAADRTSWARLPDTVPLLHDRHARVPHVVALVDRGGADLSAVGVDGSTWASTVGDGDPVRKVAPGEWTQPHLQQRAEEDWRETAAAVARAVAGLAAQAHARVVVLGGDDREVHLVLADLPAEVAARTHLINPGRAADGSEAVRRREISRLLATATAEDTVEVLHEHDAAGGAPHRAVDGFGPTVEALRRAAVDVLLVPDLDVPAWVGDDPLEVDDPEASTRTRARLVDALVRAAVATGAGVRVVPTSTHLTDGLGALLRWSATD